jgi:hypothetical protein
MHYFSRPVPHALCGVHYIQPAKRTPARESA